MRRVFILIVMLLFLVSCTKGDEVASKLDQYRGTEAVIDELDIIDDLGPTEFVREDEIETNESEDWVPEEEPVKETVKKEILTGETECTTDSKGVVRVIYADGSKKIYRDDCQPNGIVITYKCVGNTVKDEAKICSSGACKPGPYGDTCVL